MANIKSAKKRIKVIAKKTLRNKMIRTRTKTAIKKVIVTAGKGVKEDAKKVLIEAISVIDKAASKGILHKKNASRKKSRLTKLVNKIGA